MKLYLNLRYGYYETQLPKTPHRYISLFFTFLGSGKWFEMQDLHTSLVLPEILPLSEAYIQIYERRAMK